MNDIIAFMAENNSKEQIPVLFGNNVRKYRKKAGLTQEELSKQLNISQKHLSIIETGNQFASASLIAKISDTLCVSPAALFGGENQEMESAKLFVMLDNFFRPRFAALSSRLDSIEKKLPQNL